MVYTWYDQNGSEIFVEELKNGQIYFLNLWQDLPLSFCEIMLFLRDIQANIKFICL